jgi:hypothetical protein
MEREQYSATAGVGIDGSVNAKRRIAIETSCSLLQFALFTA